MRSLFVPDRRRTRRVAQNEAARQNAQELPGLVSHPELDLVRRRATLHHPVDLPQHPRLIVRMDLAQPHPRIGGEFIDGVSEHLPVARAVVRLVRCHIPVPGGILRALQHELQPLLRLLQRALRLLEVRHLGEADDDLRHVARLIEDGIGIAHQPHQLLIAVARQPDDDVSHERPRRHGTGDRILLDRQHTAIFADEPPPRIRDQRSQRRIVRDTQQLRRFGIGIGELSRRRMHDDARLNQIQQQPVLRRAGAKRVLRRAPRGDVPEQRHHARARHGSVLHRQQDEIIPERRAVRSMAEQFPREQLAGGERVADPLHRVRVRVRVRAERLLERPIPEVAERSSRQHVKAMVGREHTAIVVKQHRGERQGVE